MADIKIVQLPAIASQQISDIYETSANGTGSFKESRAQQNTYWNANVQLPSTAKVTGLDAALASKLNLSGGIMTGFLTLNADPSTNLQAATKQYVDNSFGALTLQDAYNNSSAPQKIAFAPGQGLIFADHSNTDRFIFTETYATFLNDFIVSKTGDEGLSVLATSDPTSTMLEVLSPSKGAKPVPALTQTQIDDIPTAGIVDYLQAYNKTLNTQDYWDSNNWQHGLTIDNTLAGTNVTLDKVSQPGKVIINSSGGGDAPIGSYGSYEVFNNSSGNTFTGVAGGYKTLPIGNGFSVPANAESNCSTTIETIGGVNTPVTRYLDTATQAFAVSQTIAIQSNNASPRHYYPTFSIIRADNSIEQTSFRGSIFVNNSLAAPTTVTVVGDIVLGQGDGIFPQVYLTESDAGGFCPSITSSLVSIAGTGTPAIGSFTAGNLPVADNTDGGYIDSGVALNNLVLLTGNQTIAGTKTFSSTIVGDISGNAVTASTAVNANNFNTLQASTNVSFYPIFVASTTNGYQQARLSTGISLNPSTNIITATSFTGNLTGTATNATNVNTTINSSNADFYPPFVTSSGVQPLQINLGYSFNPLAGVLTTPNLVLSALSANQLVGLNSGKIAASIGAGTSTQVLHGNASGLPTWAALDLANDITGTLGFTNGGFGFNTATTGDIFCATASNTPGKISAVAAGSVMASAGVGTLPAWSSTPSLSTLALTGGGGSTSAGVFGASASAITGTTPVFDFSSNYSDASYFRFGTTGAIGVTSTGRMFSTKNLDYDGSTGNYKYMNSAFGYAIELSAGGFIVSTAPSGTAGNTATMTTVLSATNGSAAVTGSLSVSNGANAGLQTDNSSKFQQKNSGGTYETWANPRASDNIMYFDIGSSGLVFRQNSAGTQFLTADTSGNVSFAQGNVLITTAAKTFTLKSGANGSTGSATFTTGSATISTTAAAANDIIDIMVTTASNQGFYSVAVSAGTGYTVTSSNGSDASSFKWKRTAVA